MAQYSTAQYGASQYGAAQYGSFAKLETHVTSHSALPTDIKEALRDFLKSIQNEVLEDVSDLLTYSGRIPETISEYWGEIIEMIKSFLQL